MARRNIEAETEEAIEAIPVEINDRDTVKKNKTLLLKKNLISSGSTMINLGCTGTPYGWMLKGKCFLLVGESDSGKTWLIMNTYAETNLHERFKNYKLIYDCPEFGANMDIAHYFGKKTATRLEEPEPNRVDENGLSCPFSMTVEQFYDSLDKHLDKAEEGGYGIIYALDSMDALSSEAEMKKSAENRKIRSKVKKSESNSEGKEEKTKGSMGDGKAKINSQNLRRIIGRLEKTGSILIIICQERDNLGSLYDTKTFAGGRSLKFYATIQFWLKKREDIMATIKGKKRPLGTRSVLNICKNHLTGEKDREISLPIYRSFGIDEVGSMVEWLIDESYWAGGEKELAKIKATEFGVELAREQLIRYIENNNLEDKLREIVVTYWQEIQALVEQRVQRKRRYE